MVRLEERYLFNVQPIVRCARFAFALLTQRESMFRPNSSPKAEKKHWTDYDKPGTRVISPHEPSATDQRRAGLFARFAR